MSNPTKIYNDYVRANLPNTMTFNSSTARYNINNHSFFSFNRANWYFKYITKYGYISLSAYAVNNFDPDLVFDFKQNYYRKGGADTTLSSAVTHTRAGNATMVDSNGKIKWAPHNLLIRSEELNLWSQGGTGSAVVNNAVAPDGTTTAATLTSGSTNFQRYILSSGTYTAGDKITYSFWARSDTVTTLPFGINGGTNGSNNNIFSSIAVTSTWNLVEFEFTVIGDDSSLYYIIGKQSQNPVNCQLGDVEIWHPHVYRSDLGGMVNNPAQPTGFETYVPTTSSAVYLPRVGHHAYNGSAWVNEGVLHESEARTNLVTYSNDFNHSTWTKYRVGITQNVSGVTGPDGTQTVDKITPIATNEQHRVWYGVSSTAVGETYSAYVKSAGYDYVWVGYYEAPAFKYAIVNLTNGAVTSSNADNYSVEDVGNGFYRISVIKTIFGAGSSRYISIAPSPTASPTLDGNGAPYYVGDGTSGVYVYGTQIEAGFNASSYTPTSGSQVTRAADTLTVPAANLPYSSTNVSIQIDGKITYADDGSSDRFVQWGNQGDDEIRLNLEYGGAQTGSPVFIQRAGGVIDILSDLNAYSPNINVPFNIASRHGSTFINGAVDGTALTADTTPTALPNLSSSTLSLGFDFMGTIGKFRVWDEDLTDAGIVEAST